MIRLIPIAVAIVALAAGQGTARASSGLVGQWRLDEGVGTVVTDSSGFGDNGTVLGGTAWASGPNGSSALAFDGATGRVDVPNAPELQPTTAITVSAWIERLGSPGIYRYIVAKGATSCIASSYGLYSGPTGGLMFYVSRQHGTTYERSPDAGSGVWNGQWHFVVGTFDGSNIRLYVDGNEVGSGTSYPGALGYMLPDASDLYIGDYPGCQAKNFLGEIADVQIWDRALSATEVAALAQPPQQPLPPAPVQPVTPSQGGSVGVGQIVSPPPALRVLKLSLATFQMQTVAGRLVVSYTDSQRAQVTFTIMKLTPAQPCFQHARRTALRRCARYIKVGQFRHYDLAGRNTVRLPKRFRFTPGSYELLATPTANGKTGKTVGVSFKVVR